MPHSAFTSVPHTHTPVYRPFSGTTQVSRYQKGKTNLDFTEARDSEWQWHQLGRMQICTSLHTDNHASTPPLTFLHAGCPSCHPTNSVKPLKDNLYHILQLKNKIKFSVVRQVSAPLSCFSLWAVYSNASAGSATLFHDVCSYVACIFWWNLPLLRLLQVSPLLSLLVSTAAV